MSAAAVINRMRRSAFRLLFGSDPSLWMNLWVTSTPSAELQHALTALGEVQPVITSQAVEIDDIRRSLIELQRVVEDTIDRSGATQANFVKLQSSMDEEFRFAIGTNTAEIRNIVLALTELQRVVEATLKSFDVEGVRGYCQRVDHRLELLQQSAVAAKDVQQLVALGARMRSELVSVSNRYIAIERRSEEASLAIDAFRQVLKSHFSSDFPIQTPKSGHPHHLSDRNPAGGAGSNVVPSDAGGDGS